WTSIELPGFFVVTNNGAYSGRSEEGGNAGAAGANPLGKSTLRDEVKLQLALQNQLLEQFVFPDVSPGMLEDLARGQQQAVAQSIHPDIVADGRQVLRSLANQGANQVFRNST